MENDDVCPEQGWCVGVYWKHADNMILIEDYWVEVCRYCGRIASPIFKIRNIRVFENGL